MVSMRRIPAVLLLMVSACGAGARSSAVDDLCSPQAGAVVTEAGFLELADDPPATSQARLFYSFQPADDRAQERPLAVFFNGGPGTSTAILMSQHTGRRTLDPSLAGSAVVGDNPFRFTAFANLLYVDARQTGFSYDVVSDVADEAGRFGDSAHLNQMEDAAEMVRAVIGFLHDHPALRCNPVVLVGESYGGLRATLMLDFLLHYRELERGGGIYQNQRLAQQIQAHFDGAFPSRAGSEIPPELASRQFGRQILIQPGLGPMPTGQLPPGRDPYNDAQPDGWTTHLEDAIAAAVTRLDSLQALLGVDPRGIELMRPAARANALRTAMARDASTVPPLSEVFGPPNPFDWYFLMSNGQFFPSTNGWELDLFSRNLVHVKTFMTNAAHDRVVVTPAIADGLAHLQAVSAVAIDVQPQPGVERPGWMKITYADRSIGARTIRFPTYADSGHPVSATQPRELSADIAAWLNE
jgi:hypothetical protein